ncbi:MAG: glycosyltransferase family 2 protein, partial [Parvibaculum sp.]|nr:glycosyltransferase family 2 protein [Parvibaculum sp.]
MVRFSVVIPVHNKVAHVLEAIESVVAQTYAPYEVILVDDASTDGSAERIASVKDDRIRILKRSEPGPGGYAARNLAIKEAKGDWIAFLDADDAWKPDHLEKVAEVIAGADKAVGVIFTG